MDVNPGKREREIAGALSESRGGGGGQPERRKGRVGQVPPIYNEFDAFDGRVRGDARETGGIEQMRVSTRQMSDERCNNVRIHFVSGCFIFVIFFCAFDGKNCT